MSRQPQRVARRRGGVSNAAGQRAGAHAAPRARATWLQHVPLDLPGRVGRAPAARRRRRAAAMVRGRPRTWTVPWLAWRLGVSTPRAGGAVNGRMPATLGRTARGSIPRRGPRGHALAAPLGQAAPAASGAADLWEFERGGPRRPTRPRTPTATRARPGCAGRTCSSTRTATAASCSRHRRRRRAADIGRASCAPTAARASAAPTRLTRRAWRGRRRRRQVRPRARRWRWPVRRRARAESRAPPAARDDAQSRSWRARRRRAAGAARIAGDGAGSSTRALSGRCRRPRTRPAPQAPAGGERWTRAGARSARVFGIHGVEPRRRARLPRPARAAAPRPGVDRHRQPRDERRASASRRGSAWSPTSSTPDRLASLPGRLAIGHNRYSTAGGLDARERAAAHACVYRGGRAGDRPQRQPGQRARAAARARGARVASSRPRSTPRSSCTSWRCRRRRRSRSAWPRRCRQVRGRLLAGAASPTERGLRRCAIRTASGRSCSGGSRPGHVRWPRETCALDLLGADHAARGRAGRAGAPRRPRADRGRAACPRRAAAAAASSSTSTSRAPTVDRLRRDRRPRAARASGGGWPRSTRPTPTS